MFRLQATHRHRPGPTSSQICQICTSVIARNPQPAKRPLATLVVDKRGPRGKKIISDGRASALLLLSAASASTPSNIGRAHLSTLASRLRGGRGQGQGQNLSPASLRSRSSSLSGGTKSTAQGTQQKQQQPEQGSQQQPQQQPSPLEKVVAPVQHVKKVFLAQDGIPSEESTLAALRTCEVAAGLLMKVHAAAASVPQQLKPRAGTAASRLLSMDRARGSASSSAEGGSGDRGSAPAAKGNPLAHSGPASNVQRSFPSGEASPTATTKISASSSQLKSVIDSISDTAYAIVSLPSVVITPQVLERYVSIQSRLGRAETLPHVLHLFASKSKPVLQYGAAGSRSIRYVKQNPNRLTATVEPALAETVLDAAIEAKNLDAAVGIVEQTYATKAFMRTKVVRRALLPAAGIASLPGLIYVLASNLSHFQNTMDDSSARTVFFTGIIAYLGFTGAIGLVASATGNDQMKRVTWTPGTPLTQRWIREEERAALDKVACAFGFSEEHRFGEEEGSEWESLREYILQRGMLLDRVELMEGLGG